MSRELDYNEANSMIETFRAHGEDPGVTIARSVALVALSLVQVADAIDGLTKAVEDMS